MEPRWVAVLGLDELPVGGARVVKRQGRQIALFRLDLETVYAVDNQCPHEGYPLSQGYVKDCLLTCAWHNYKFDIRDGTCVMGDEAVRTYPVRIADRQLELDLTEPDPGLEIPGLLLSLEEGLLKRGMGRAARDVVRLLKAGYPPEQLALFAARFDADYAEYGSTHALAVAADVLRYLGRYPGLEAARPLMQAMDMASEPSVRLPRRAVPAPIDPGEDPVAAGQQLRELVVAEDAATAEGLLRGALARGWGREVVEPWLYRLCTDYFLDFGHALIYQVKVFDLLERVGWSHASALLPAHLFRIVNATREDTLPGVAPFRRRLDALEPEMPELLARQVRPPAGRWRREAFLEAVLDGTMHDMFGAVEEALRDGVALTQIVDALSIAAAERILRFDAGIDVDPTVQEGWLDVTHILTYCNAVRHGLRRYRAPEALRLVFYAARFVHNERTLDLPDARRLCLEPVGIGEVPEGIPALVAAIRARRPEEAVCSAVAYVTAGQPVDPLWDALEDLALNDPATRAVFVAHVIKTILAAREEYGALEGSPDRCHLLYAAVRFAASPLRERSVGRLTGEAIGFVGSGRVPRRLTD